MARMTTVEIAGRYRGDSGLRTTRDLSDAGEGAGSTLDQSIGERQELAVRENVNVNVGTGLAPVLIPTLPLHIQL